MQPRFLALVGGDDEARRRRACAASAATGLACIFNRSGIEILANPECTPLPLGDTGVVLGSLFTRDAVPRRFADAGHDAASLLHIDERMIRHAWGNYVAVDARPSRPIRVLRGPAGALPCYVHQDSALILIGSDMETLVTSGLIAPPPVNWSALADHLWWGEVPRDTTMLAGISELAHGAMLTINDRGMTWRPLWSPWDHVASHNQASDLVDRLREVIIGSVRALASTHSRVLLRASGGLDSSIIAAALADRPERFGLLTMVAAGAGDERAYAQTLADALGVTLDACPYSLDDVDLGQASYPHLPRPMGRCIGQAVEAAVHRVAAARGCDAIFTGTGGDGLFGHFSSATPAADRLQREGPGRGFLSTIADLAAVTGASVGTVAWRALRRAARAPAYCWRSTPSFLHPDVGAGRAFPGHPWLAAPRGAVPGQALAIAGLLRLQGRLDGYRRASQLPDQAPLLAQPIIEFCLSVPSWLWSSGGTDRVLARRAFADLLPPSIAWRRSKGGPESFCVALLDHKRDEARARLLDGHLAGAGLLDLPALDRFFREPRATKGVDYLRVLELIDAEAWVAHWTRRSVVVAAAPLPD